MRQEHSELFVANVVEHLWQRKIILWLQCPQLTFWDTRDTKNTLSIKPKTCCETQNALTLVFVAGCETHEIQNHWNVLSGTHFARHMVGRQNPTIWLSLRYDKLLYIRETQNTFDSSTKRCGVSPAFTHLISTYSVCGMLSYAMLLLLWVSCVL